MFFFVRSFWNVPVALFLVLLGGSGKTCGQQAVPVDSPSPAPPVITSGSVTLPYSELKELLDAASAAKSPPPRAKAPVSSSVQSSRYTIHFDADLKHATGEAVFEVVSFADGWTTVPLLPTKEIRLAGVEPEGTFVAVRDGSYTLMLDAPGRRVVTLRFSVDVADGNVARALALRLTGPSALVNEVSVTGVPDGWLLEAPGAMSAAAASGGKADDLTAPLPVVFRLAADQPVALQLIRKEDRKPVVPLGPSMWQSDAQSLVRYDDGQLVYKACLRLSADAGLGQSAEFTLPAGTNVLSVSGDDLDHWQMAKSENSGGRRVEIFWKTPEVLHRDLTFGYEIPQSALEGNWQLVSPRPTAESGHLHSALYVLPTTEGIEFLPGDGGGPLGLGDERQLPRKLAGEIGTSSFLTVVSEKPAPADNSAMTVRSHRLPLMKTMRATVEESRFRTRLVADGAFLSEGTLNVRHEGPLAFGISLPKGTQLLGCSVNGRDALPIDRGEGKLDLNLPAETVGKPTRIELSCTGRLPALAPVSGQVALSLPATELFVQTLFWDLQIPDEYELSALEGNVAVAPVSTSTQNAAPAIHLRKDLLKAEQPAVELFYQKRAANP